MKHYFLAAFFIFILSFNFVYSQVEKNEVYFFYSSTCPHCIEEKNFLDKIEKKYPELIIKRYEISKKESINLLNKYYEKYNVPEKQRGYVPVTFTFNNYFIGFNEDIGKEIESCIRECLIGDKKDVTKKVNLPFLGQIDPSQFSLAFLAVIFGIVDGFDLCSLAALFLVLTIVLSLNSRFKVLFFGGVFILINAFTYGILMSFWWKVFNFFGVFLRKMEILIALLSFLGGLYFMRKFFQIRKKGAKCEIEQGWGKNFFAKGAEKIKELFQKGNAFYIILGLLIFDFIISVVEFPCSGVLPVIFTAILSEAKVSNFWYFVYLIIFLFFYLLDEIIIFLISVFTMKLWVRSPKFVSWANFALAILLFFLGIFYLFGLD